ncbi:Microtubule-associated protein 70 [Quillaja saponaria]|uniref:Microtubule-associated protein 70 n=1 Tax=Quillaja saponaria TaxID=32244 RepID=A0AAD7PUK9_QUISA|nr:Microtubule-associated protein 70 [Quillaja saponaria]
MVGYEEQHSGENISLAQPDPVVLELNRLQNLVKEKDKELGVSHGEIKALRATEALKDKAIEELRSEASKLDDKNRMAENLLEQKNLEIKKLTEEKKDAVAALYAAEAALRRVHANQKDDDSLPLASIIAPLEAEIKLYKNEIATLQEDKKALERLTKSKEAALLEAERILKSALERALIVEEVQNQNFDLRRQIEILQEENRILEKTNRQKVSEVEKLSQTIQELEEVILASGAAANAVRDYQRQISQLQEEKRTLVRELARIKVSANRVATVVANEWKDENDKVMPVKQWLEERRLLQAEMQRLRDKLAVSDRTAKAEAQLKEKLKLRLKTLEEGLKNVPSNSVIPNTFCGSPKAEKPIILSFLTANGRSRKRSTSQPRASSTRSSFLQLQNAKNDSLVGVDIKQGSSFKMKYPSGENMVKKGLWASRNKVVDSGEKENEMQSNSDMNVNNCHDEKIAEEVKTRGSLNEESRDKSSNVSRTDDIVSGFLYDRLQKEVINLRKYCESKESSLHAKDEEIKLLMKKVDALTKSIEVESKKSKREAAAREKEAASTKAEDNRKIRITNSSKRVTKA